MALRDQPYIALYVQDYLTDEKLNSCSAATQGVYIKIMCILHKQDNYGIILLKQKDKQKSSSIENFALKFANLLPFSYEIILSAISECVEEGVLKIEGDKLYQKRMVKDGEISLKRSKAGKSGGGNPVLFKQIDKQTDKQNPENENEINNLYPGINKEIKIDFENSKIEMENAFSLREKLMRLYNISEQVLDKKIELFFEITEIQYPRTWKDTESHILNWMPKNLKGSNETETKKVLGYSINDVGKRKIVG